MADAIADPPADLRPRRGKGRPLANGPAVGREALIKAACELLEQMPPAKVTRAEVARHAGVDPALIRYYFRDRASLLKAVIEQVTSSYLTMDPLENGRNSEERLRNTAKAFLIFMLQRPYFHRLMLEELAASDSDDARELFATINRASAQHFGRIVEAGVAAGELKHVNPRLVHIAHIGLCEFFVTARPIFDAMDEDVDMDRLTEEYAELIGDMVVGGLKRTD